MILYINQHFQSGMISLLEVLCQFSGQGCQAVMKRRNMKDHLHEEITGHLLMLKKSFDEQVETLKQNFDTQVKTRDLKIRNLERSLADTGDTSPYIFEC